MDNVTHSLIGFTLGRSVFRKDPKIQKAGIWTAILGSNLPDLDFLLRSYTVKGNLGYLLQHRGYTHTILLAIPVGILAGVAGARIAKLQRPPFWKLSWLGIVSVLLHIGADFCNNYGVHPLWPFSNQWFYGDFIFIVEPLYWLSLLPLVFFTSVSIWGKVLSAGLGIGILALASLKILNPFPVFLGLCAWALLSIGFQKKFRSVALAWTSILLILSSFWMASRTARSEWKTALQCVGDGCKIYEISSTPAPSNPFCWSMIAMSTEQEKANIEYVVRLGVYSLKPEWFDPAGCYLPVSSERLAPLSPVSLPSPAGLRWTGEFRRPIGEFEKFSETSCLFRAWLKFSRIPVWFKRDGSWVAEDIRYDQGSRNSFSEIGLDLPQECPKSLPPWEPPTSTLHL